LATSAPEAAAASAAAVLATKPDGFLLESALWLAGDAAEVREQWTDAVRVFSGLVAQPLVPTAMADALHRLGRSAQKAGQTDLAIQSYIRVHDEHPASSQAVEAAAALKLLRPSFQAATRERLSIAMRRADQLYAARKFSDARTAFDDVKPFIGPAERDLVDLRLAQIEAQLKRFPTALQALQSYVTAGRSRADEAEYFRLGVLRDIGNRTNYVNGVRAFAARGGTSPFVESALNDLGTHYILTDDDAKSAAVFTEQYDRFPTGTNAGRAAWKAGWWAYTNANYTDTVRLFESAAIGLRRSDYRSGWVYWAAKAHERLGHRDRAGAG
jgi:TolA-binding protein